MAEVANVEQSSLDALSSCEVSERVKRGDYILKKKKNTKGSHAWQRFRTVYDESCGEEVFGYAAVLLVRLVCVTKSL